MITDKGSGAESSRAPQQRSDRPRGSRLQTLLQERTQQRDLQQKIDSNAIDLQRLNLEQRVQLVEKCVQLPKENREFEQRLVDSIAFDIKKNQDITWVPRLMGAAAQQPRKSSWRNLAHHLGDVMTRTSDTIESLPVAAETLSHFSRFPDDRKCQDACAKLYNDIRSQAAALATEDISVVSNVLGSLHGVTPPSGADDLARHCLQRVDGLIKEDPQLTSVSSEQLSQLCHNMTVLFSSPDYIQHKRAALDLMAGDLLRAAGRKFDTADTVESNVRLMKSLQLASRELGDGTGQDNQANHDAKLKRANLQRFLLESRKRLDADRPDADPHLARLLDSEDSTRTLDVHVVNNAARLQSEAAPSVFESKFDAMWQQRSMSPIPVGDTSGLMDEVTVDHLGNELKVAPQARYSPFADLSDNRIDFVRVELPPGQLSPDDLNRTVPYEKKEYRIDAFAGNAAKQAAPPLWGQNASAQPPSNGVVWGVPVEETAPGAGFSEMTAKLLPSRQHFFYAERAGFPGAPRGPSAIESEQTQQESPAQDPTAHVLKGRMRVAYVSDDSKHPFQIRTPQGQVQLRAYDGHGFIKRSVASEMRAYNDNPGILLGDKKEGGRIPSQCLQHYPNDEGVVKEAVDAMAHSLEQSGSSELSADQIHRCVTSANLQTRVGIAVPSANENLYLGNADPLRGTSPGDNATLYLRSPYIDQSIRVAEPGQVKGQEDVTAQYLSGTKAIQYTLLTQTRLEADDRETMDALVQPEATPDPNKFFYSFHKGLYTVVDDQDWPDEFKDVSIVMPSGDRKTHSNSPDQKLLPADGARAEVAGILVATNIYHGRSLVAVPTQPWKDSGGDFDGDTVNRIDLQQHGVPQQSQDQRHYPKLQDHIKQCEARRLEGKQIELKPPKQQTSAVTEHRGLGAELAGQIDAWLGVDSKPLPEGVAASLKEQHDAVAANNPGSSAHVRMNALLDAINEYDASDSDVGKRRIGKTLAETPRSSHAYDFGRSAEFLSTRQQLTQDFARWQNIYLYVDSDKRTAVAREIVKEIYEGIPPDTAKDVTHLLSYSDDTKTTEERFSKLDVTLRQQRDDESKDQDVRDRIGALHESLQTWKKEWDSARGDAEIAAREDVWQKFRQTPKRQHEAPEDWPARNSSDLDSYYRQTAELWLKLGNYVGTDIYKTSGDIGQAWKQMSSTAERTFQRLERDGNYGVRMNVPYGRRPVAKLIEGSAPVPNPALLMASSNLAGGIMGGSAGYLAKNRPEVFFGIANDQQQETRRQMMDTSATRAGQPRQRQDHVSQPLPARQHERSPSRFRGPG